MYIRGYRMSHQNRINKAIQNAQIHRGELGTDKNLKPRSASLEMDVSGKLHKHSFFQHHLDFNLAVCEICWNVVEKEDLPYLKSCGHIVPPALLLHEHVNLDYAKRCRCLPRELQPNCGCRECFEIEKAKEEV